jgi:glucokinase-like ROK family protein
MHGRGPVAGIDIGGTKIAILVVDADGAVLGRATRSSSVADQDGAAVAIAACLDEALAAAGLRRDDLDAIGVGVPGRVDPHKGHVTLAVNLGWTDYALRDALETELGRPVVIENDARAAAMGLHARGVAGVTDDLAYLAVGTGIAAGVILDGRLHRGARGLAGEIGHAIAEPDGPRCVCGQLGCLEAFASGPSIARRAAERGSHATSAVEVYQAAAAGDPVAGELTDDVGRRLAWAVHLLVMTYDVERVVVGGGVSHAGSSFEAPLRRELARLRAASESAAELLPADIVDVLPPEAEAGAWGAVAVARTARITTPGSGSEVVSHA